MAISASYEGAIMKVCYLGCELGTHVLATRSTLRALEKRGHTVERRIWHYGKEATEITFKNSDADVFLSDGHYKNTAFPDTDPSPCGVAEMPDRRFLWVQLSHGISPYKPWGCSAVGDATKIRLVPTLGWQKHASKTATSTSFTVDVNGWCKMDQYYKALQNKQELKELLFSKYNFKHGQPLIVYAPTGIRQHAPTRSEWAKKYGTEAGYAWHGSYYHNEKVKKIASDISNFYEIPHPTIARNDVKDRVSLMAISDMMIGDISSMSLEYTCVNKPIVLLRKNIEDSAPTDFRLFGEKENPIVDLGDIVGVKELSRTIAYRLIHDDYKEIRNRWRELLLGEVDGKCGEREAIAIERLWEKHEQQGI